MVMNAGMTSGYKITVLIMVKMTVLIMWMIIVFTSSSFHIVWFSCQTYLFMN